MATPEEIKAAKNQADFDALVATVGKLHATTANQVLNEAKFQRRGGFTGETTLGGEIAWLAANFAKIESSNAAQTQALIGALAAVNKGEPFDEAKLLSSVQAAAAAGVQTALDGLEVRGDVVNLEVGVKQDGRDQA